MTSAIISDFFTPSLPCHEQKSADFFSFVCFLGALPHLSADVIYGSTLMAELEGMVDGVEEGGLIPRDSAQRGRRRVRRRRNATLIGRVVGLIGHNTGQRSFVRSVGRRTGRRRSQSSSSGAVLQTFSALQICIPHRCHLLLGPKICTGNSSK